MTTKKVRPLFGGPCMNAVEALAHDTEFFVEDDKDFGWGVFGASTGFCFLLASKAECEVEAARLAKDEGE